MKGKYISSEKPGPWAEVFNCLKIDVFSLGPMFIGFGLLWLIWIYSFWVQKSWSYVLGIMLSIGTVWYLPVGTFFSLIILLILVFEKSESNF